jgi:hypothetical protein
LTRQVDVDDAPRRRSSVDKGIELLKLTGPHNRQQAFDGAFALMAPRAQPNLPPLSQVADYAE